MTIVEYGVGYNKKLLQFVGYYGTIGLPNKLHRVLGGFFLFIGELYPFFSTQ